MGENSKDQAHIRQPGNLEGYGVLLGKRFLYLR